MGFPASSPVYCTEQDWVSGLTVEQQGQDEEVGSVVIQSFLDMASPCHFWTGLCCPRAGKCTLSVLCCICSPGGASRHSRFEKGTKANRKRLGQASRVTNLYF